MNKSILVIEDNEKNSFLLEDMLSDKGYDVVTARDGADVEQKMIEKEKIGSPFDLIITDIAVPGFNPFEFIKANKEKYRIISCSAYCDAMSIVGLLDKKWCLKKPFDITNFIEIVKDRMTSYM